MTHRGAIHAYRIDLGTLVPSSFLQRGKSVSDNRDNRENSFGESD